MGYIHLLTHPSTHVERERKEHMMSRLQAHQQPHQEGLALCHRVTLDSVAHRWVPAMTTLNSEGRGWPSTTFVDDNRRQDTDKRQDKRSFRKQVQTDTCELPDQVIAKPKRSYDLQHPSKRTME